MDIYDTEGLEQAKVSIEDGEITTTQPSAKVIIGEYDDLVKYPMDLPGRFRGDDYITPNGVAINLKMLLNSMTVAQEQHVGFAKASPHRGSGNVEIDDNLSSERLDMFVTVLKDRLRAKIAQE
jgi:hypothetical protein